MTFVLRLLGRDAPADALDGSRFTGALVWNLVGRVGAVGEVALLLVVIGQAPSVGSIALIGGLLLAAGLIAFVVPQGIGVFEATTVLAFQLAGLPPAAALAFALIRRGRMIAVSLAGVAIHLASVELRPATSRSTHELEPSSCRPSAGG